MLLSNQQLNESQLRDLRQLTELCQNADGGLPAIYYPLISQKRDTENNVFYYQHENLLGFLSVYFFYPDAVEVSLLTAPSHRRQGIASQLLQKIMPLLVTKNINKLIFSTSSSFGDKWLPEKGFAYQQSEYHMERNSFETLLISNQSLTLRKATMADMDVLCSLDIACFPEHQTDMIERFTFLINSSDYDILLATNNDLILGKAHINWQNEKTLLSDIAILPDYQGRGFGGELLSHCINHALSLGKINLALDVETKNQSALNLYLRHGFKTTHIYDYWTTPLNKLKDFNNECSPD
ncbi:MAG: GNAT family N-acetyltransferase [Legionella sp.]|nr:GNAT family N-acetyltransferase [Legionella sp.]